MTRNRWWFRGAQFCLLAVALWGLFGCSAEGRSCQTHEDCDTGFFCNTQKLCKQGCRLSIECPVGQVCKVNECIELQRDEDEDGFPKPLDCDDEDRLINPGAKELCGNKKDDNCDGEIDEEGCTKVDCRPGESRACYDGKESTLTFPGTRCRKGRQVCTSAGVWGDCQGQVLPAPELCDGKDNDCNGKIDDGQAGAALSRACYSAAAETRNKGICKAGTQTCVKGTWTACKGEIKPTKETCDGKDNDCDGKIDNVEGVGEVCETSGLGACKKGHKVCDAKTQQVRCEALQTPIKEVCGDGVDDDCDGVIDDGCPYIPIKVGELRSFPHYIAVSRDYVAISLRDTKKLALYDPSGAQPKWLREVALPAAPYGVQIDKNVAYVTTSEALYQLDLSDANSQPVAWVKFAGASHAGGLLLHSGRAYTRRAETDAKGQKHLHLCQTDLAAKQSHCAALTGAFQKIGDGLALAGVFALVLSDRGLHSVDILSLQEDSNSPFQAGAAPTHVAVDPQTQMIALADPSIKKVHLVDQSRQKLLASIEIKDEQGRIQTPGHVLAIDGKVYVGHRDGVWVSVIDLRQKKVVQALKVCLAPQGMAAGTQDPKLGTQLWVTCPGDNTVWTFWTGP